MAVLLSQHNSMDLLERDPPHCPSAGAGCDPQQGAHRSGLDWFDRLL